MDSIRGDKLSIVNNIRRQTQNHPLAQLPDDILFLIFEKLGLVDRIRAKTVCKKWFQHISEIPNQGEFPLLFRHKIYGDKVPAGCKVKLTDEFSKRSYLIDAGQHLYGAKICASKFGWILMRKIIWNYSISIKFKFFVYCPFNSKLMNLPSLNSPAHGILTHYTYSSNPTLSSDCVFFAISTHNSHRIEISTCRIGDMKWKFFEIKLSNIPYVKFSFECVNGLLYVVLLRENNDRDVDLILNSHVGTFDPKSQEWKLLKNENGFMKKSSNGKTFKIRSWKMFLVVYNNKELYLFCEIRRFGSDDVLDFFKYDMKEKQWVEQPILGNRVLFIGSYCSSILVEAVGKLSNMANKAIVDIHGSPYCYCYSFSSRKVESNGKFYVDDRNSEYRMFYESAWIDLSTY